LHEESERPSEGQLLRDVVADPRIKEVTVASPTSSGLPKIILKNIWNEQFLIEYVAPPTFAHAIELN
jgi:hypothetical protein